MSAAQSGEGVVLISEVIMALTSPVTGKAVSFANLNQPVAILSLNTGTTREIRSLSNSADTCVYLALYEPYHRQIVGRFKKEKELTLASLAMITKHKQG